MTKKLSEYIIDQQFDDIDKLIISEYNIESYKNSPALKLGILESLGIFKGCKEITEYIFNELKEHIGEEELPIDITGLNVDNKFFDSCFLHIKYGDEYESGEAGYYASDGHDDYNEVRYDIKNEKFRFIEIELKFSKNYINNIYSLIMHELVHAYDDYIHIKKTGFDNSLYQRNKRNKYNLIQTKTENDDIITQIFKDFMYLLDKSEQNAYIGQLNNEVKGNYNNIKDIINDLKKTTIFVNYKTIKLNFNAIIKNKKYTNQFCNVYRQIYDSKKSNESIIKELNNKYNKCWKKFINHLYHIAEEHLIKENYNHIDSNKKIITLE